MNNFGRPSRLSALLGAAVLGFANTCPAPQVSVPNFSFETPSALGRPFDFQDNNGLAPGSAIPESVQWYYLGGFIQSGSPVGVQVTTSSGLTAAPNGTQSAYVNNGAWMGSESLTLISAQTQYTLDFWEGRRTGFPQNSGFTVALAFGASAGDTGLTNPVNWLVSAHYTLAESAPSGGWSNMPALVYTTLAAGPEIGQSLFVLLGSDADPGNFAQQVNFDNILLDATVIPEPSTVALAAAGIAALALRRRRMSR